MCKLVVFVAVTLALSQTIHAYKKANYREIQNVSELTLSEKLLTLYLSQTNPNYKNVPNKLLNFSSVSPKPQVFYSLFDAMFIEFGSLILQSRHWGVTNPLPEIDWHYGVNYCYCYMGVCFCVDQAHSWTSRNSQFHGTDTIQLKTDWTPETFVQTFTIGNYTWWSPEGTTLDEDFLNRGSITCTGFWAQLLNVSFTIAGAYSFGYRLGLQVDALTLEFSADNITFGQNGCVQRTFDGSEIETGPVLIHYADILLEGFEYYRTVFVHSIQTRFNCFLSEGKYVPPPPSDEDDDWFYDKECGFEQPAVANFVKMTTLQMFQMMGAGSHE